MVVGLNKYIYVFVNLQQGEKKIYKKDDKVFKSKQSSYLNIR